MEKIKAFFASKKLTYWFTLASAVSAIIFFIFYLTTDNATSMLATFLPGGKLSATVIVLGAAAIVIGVALCVFEIRIVKYGLYGIALLTWLEFVVSQINYVVNVIVGTDRTPWYPEFIIAVIFGLLTWVCALVAGLLDHTDEVEPDEQPEEITQTTQQEENN